MAEQPDQNDRDETGPAEAVTSTGAAMNELDLVVGEYYLGVNGMVRRFNGHGFDLNYLESMPVEKFQPTIRFVADTPQAKAHQEDVCTRDTHYFDGDSLSCRCGRTMGVALGTPADVPQVLLTPDPDITGPTESYRT